MTSEGWKALLLEFSDSGLFETHVVPINDLREHVGEECWCGARLNDEGMFVHASMDQRESYEQGRKVS